MEKIVAEKIFEKILIKFLLSKNLKEGKYKIFDKKA